MKSDPNLLTGTDGLNLSFIYDLLSGEFIFADPAFFKHFQYTEPELHPEDLLAIVHVDDRQFIRSTCNNFLKGSFKGSLQVRLNADAERWIRVTPLQISHAGSKLIAVNVCEITDEINNFYTLHKYANKKNSLLNLLAHDLRGPLAVAHSLTKALEEHLNSGRLASVTARIAGILKYSVDTITDLTQREFLETVEEKLVKRNINIAAKAAEYIEEYRKGQVVSERQYFFSTEPANVFILLDESKFIQILNNLMSNALKFTRKGGKIEFSIRDQGESVLFRFSDDGIGIPPSLQPLIFQKYSGAGREGLNGEKSNGIGLSLVKTIVEWHNGRIWFESQEEGGTVFYFEIPKVS